MLPDFMLHPPPIRCSPNLVISLCSLALALAPLQMEAEPESVPPDVLGSVHTSALKWTKLPPIPDVEGFAGAFAGVSGGVLIFAGGANITARKWEDDFVKTWYDSVFVLEGPDGVWKSGFKLPKPCAYGVSVTTDEGVVCIGGSAEREHFADVFRIQWKDGDLKFEPLPKLPRPCANGCGALLGTTIYIAGGIEVPAATTALKTFWALDLAAAEPHWQELEPWPGPERMYPVAGIQDGSFFLFSGAKLTAGPDGKPLREFLKDAYRYTPGHGWKRIADMPRAAVAAPSPAPGFGATGLLVITGDDGTEVNFRPLDKHPGFPRQILAYDTHADTWTVSREAPFSRSTAPTTQWHQQTVIPNGEVRPRVRTSEVWSVQLP